MEERIRLFLGNGYGDGYGNGYGNGYGIGYGNGYGNGDGYGDGYGDGIGIGNGYGNGNGYGCGDGDGDGCGIGNGDGLYSINGRRVYIIDTLPTIIESIHGDYARGYIVRTITDLEPTFIAKHHGYFAHGKTLHAANRDARVKYERSLSVEQRIEHFVKHHPDLETIYPAKHLFTEHGILTGSCEQGRQAFCEERGIDMSRMYSVRQFIDICRDAYGAKVIKQLEERYENT